jgi:UDP-3-O-[3-hydroxymyristoyl] glucosamine N-acyltransferase
MIAPGAVLGDGVRLGAHVVVHPGTVIGDGVVIEDGAVLGKPLVRSPHTTAPGHARPPLRVGDGAWIGARAVVFTGAVVGAGAFVGDMSHVREGAVLGEETELEAMCAIGTDAVLGARVRFGVRVWMTGFTHVEDGVTVGAATVSMNDDSMSRQGIDLPLRGPILRHSCTVGAACRLTPGVVVGERAIVGPGSLVARDVPAGARVAGVPARA